LLQGGGASGAAGSKNGETEKTEEAKKTKYIFFSDSSVFSGSPFFDLVPAAPLPALELRSPP
jgi:hypothetical protein